MSDAKLFVSGIPPQYLESDVAELFAPHGAVREVYIHPARTGLPTRSAFVRFQSRAECEAAIEALDGISFSGQVEKFHVVFSKESRRLAGEDVGGPEPRSRDRPSRRESRRSSSRGRSSGAIMGGERRHARMLEFDVTNDRARRFDVKLLDRILSKCGQPMKLQITSSAGDTCRGYALMSMDSEASRVIHDLSGRPIFGDECYITFRPSSRQDLDIRLNNNTSWDYTSKLPQAPPAPILDDVPPPAPRGSYRDDHPSPRERDGRGGRDRRDRDRRDSRDRPRGRDDDMRGSPVVVVNGVTAEVNPVTQQPFFTAQVLHQIMGVAGDVLRLKVMPAKKDERMRCALVEFRSAVEARTAVEILDGLTVFNATLVVVPSRAHNRVAPPSDPADTTVDFADYEGQRLGRFGPGFPIDRFRLVRGPSNVLYLSGLPQTVDDNLLVDMFSEFELRKAERFRSKPAEARAEFPSIEKATEALIALHNIATYGPVEFRPPLRVSYSDKALTDEPIQILRRRR